MDEIEALKEFFATDTDDQFGMDLWGNDEIKTKLGVFKRVNTQRGEQRRWVTAVEEIYVSPSGRFFSCPWERGNTECQENEYYPEKIHEVEAYEVTVTKYRRKKANG